LALLAVLLVPLMVLVLTPFIRPLRGSQLFWTYLLPVLPLVALFDGAVSCLRTYGVAELRELTARVDATNYHWDSGTVRSTTGPIPITYLIGLPKDHPTDGPSSEDHFELAHCLGRKALTGLRSRRVKIMPLLSTSRFL
jgi:hypothetical protein